ncbi:hypothetical protein GGH96_005544 [Coemansia sp. RSA 1972]|nr:hypothetical protein GGH96_005544 [Coemansia sp. RSA 1972]
MSQATQSPSPEPAGKAGAGGKKSGSVNYKCLRCSMVGTRCDGAQPKCAVCEQADVACMYVSDAGKGRLLGAAPLANRQQTTGIKKWMKLQTSTEFLLETTGQMRGPEDISEFTENPERIRGDVELPQLLRQALDEFPEEQGEEMRLPSSGLLQTIGRSIAQADARQDIDDEQVLSEYMGSSGLLALGVLLQEYSRHLI